MIWHTWCVTIVAVQRWISWLQARHARVAIEGYMTRQWDAHACINFYTHSIAIPMYDFAKLSGYHEVMETSIIKKLDFTHLINMKYCLIL